MGACEITIVYGQTDHPDVPKLLPMTVLKAVSTVGKLFPAEAKIMDPETGEECPPKCTGEFCTRGYHVMKGYYNARGYSSGN